MDGFAQPEHTEGTVSATPGTSGASPVRNRMVSRVHTVAFNGIDVLDIDCQVQLSSGMVAFNIVGLPDKAVAESRERVRAALAAMGLALPPRRITVNLAPADVLKEGSHFDLPIAVAVLMAMEVLPNDAFDAHTILGELALDGAITRVAGVLPAAIGANAAGRGIVCPAEQGGEAAWAGDIDVLAPASLLSLVNHVKGTQVLSRPEPALAADDTPIPDLRDVKGQESAKRALEIAAAGGHNLLMMGPPGSGKSMLAARLPGLLPPLSPAEGLETSMVLSVAGELAGGRIRMRRAFRDPHHSATLPALIGGGLRARPGEASLAHNGVLFLDELPEFDRRSLEALRQPLESGRAVIARANAHVTYPARFQLVAAMNPCKCGWLDDPALACGRVPRCAADYQSKISGPLFDRIDLHVDVPAVRPADLALPAPAEGTAEIAARVAVARRLQTARFADYPDAVAHRVTVNAHADGELLDDIAAPDAEGLRLLSDAADRLHLSARAWHRIRRVARTIADLDGADQVRRVHIAEALGYRRVAPGR